MRLSIDLSIRSIPDELILEKQALRTGLISSDTNLDIPRTEPNNAGRRCIIVVAVVSHERHPGNINYEFDKLPDFFRNTCLERFYL